MNEFDKNQDQGKSTGQQSDKPAFGQLDKEQGQQGGQEFNQKGEEIDQTGQQEQGEGKQQQDELAETDQQGEIKTDQGQGDQQR